MFPSRSPMGFVAILGVLALIGIVIRNSVILIVQIEEHRRAGHGDLGSGFGRHHAPPSWATIDQDLHHDPIPDLQIPL